MLDEGAVPSRRPIGMPILPRMLGRLLAHELSQRLTVIGLLLLLLARLRDLLPLRQHGRDQGPAPRDPEQEQPAEGLGGLDEHDDAPAHGLAAALGPHLEQQLRVLHHLQDDGDAPVQRGLCGPEAGVAGVEGLAQRGRGLWGGGG